MANPGALWINVADQTGRSFCAANLAEGAAKRGRREFRRYTDISLGSLGETSYLLMLARDLELITPEIWEELEDLRKRAGGLTWRLARSLQESA